MKIIVHTDGGARGNPGPAAIGVVIETIQNSEFRIQNDGTKQKTILIAEFGKRIGEATNNVAEYEAVLEALQYLKTSREAGSRSARQNSSPKADQPLAEKLPAKRDLAPRDKIEKTTETQFFLDSTLVVNQLNGLFKVKDPHLRELLTHVRILEQEVGGEIRYGYIHREQNQRADWLVNKALDISE